MENTTKKIKVEMAERIVDEARKTMGSILETLNQDRPNVSAGDKDFVVSLIGELRGLDAAARVSGLHVWGVDGLANHALRMAKKVYGRKVSLMGTGSMLLGDYSHIMADVYTKSEKAALRKRVPMSDIFKAWTYGNTSKAKNEKAVA